MTRALEGRVALVTGGNRGIGLEIARTLVDAGARVCITGRDEDALEAALGELGDAAVGVAGDVGEAADVVHAVREAEALGPLEVVVNNAASAGPTLPVHELPPEEFEAVLRTNLLGPFLVAHHALPGMIARGRGSIVNIGSIAGVEGYPLRSPYSASKWGLVGFTRTLAGEVGPHGIRVNLVAPGPTEGERATRVLSARAEALALPFEELRARYEREIPLRRFVRADEVAAAVLFLASDAASGITGQSFCVSGGIEI